MQFGIFPIGGQGRRFTSIEFVEPKPFIEIFGKTQLEWSVLSCRKNFPEAQIVIAYRSGLETHTLNFVKKFSKQSGVSIQAIDIGECTLGAAHTTALALGEIGALNQDFEFLVLDSDVAIELTNTSNLLNCAAGLVTSKSTNPGHSFVIIDERNRVKAIEEKIVISENGVAGNYFFKSASKYLDHYASLPWQSDEKYISGVIKSYLRDNLLVSAEPALTVCSFGTPSELACITLESLKFLRADFY